jgi:hypothetical protein
MRGWYVELDAKLIEEFDKIFPEPGWKVVLTSRAVVWAIQERKIPLVPLTTVGEQLLFSTPEGDYVHRREAGTESSDGGTEAVDVDGSGTGIPPGGTRPISQRRGSDTEGK